MKSLIDTTYLKSNNRSTHEMYEDMVVIEEIKRGIEEKYGEVYFMYASDEIYEYVAESLSNENGEYKKIMKVYDTPTSFFTKTNRRNGEVTRKWTEVIDNAVYYCEEEEHFFVNYNVYTDNGKRNIELMFFKNKEKMLKFIKKADEASMHTDETQIIMMTDTANGVQKERKFVSQMINPEDVILEEKLKNDIYGSIERFFDENDTFYKKYNIPHKRGILLHGSPGNGKTTMIKSLLKKVEAPIVYWQITEYTNSGTIKEVFQEISDYTPAILVIEDLDTMPNHAKSVLLNTLDGATTEEGIFLIGTTNYPERIDSAFTNRPGRFDKLYEIKLPTEDLRFQYLMMRKMTDFYTEAEIKEIASKTEDFSFVQLSELFQSCVYQKYNGKDVNIIEEIKVIKDTIKKVKKGDFEHENKSIGFV